MAKYSLNDAKKIVGKKYTLDQARGMVVGSGKKGMGAKGLEDAIAALSTPLSVIASGTHEWAKTGDPLKGLKASGRQVEDIYDSLATKEGDFSETISKAPRGEDVLEELGVPTKKTISALGDSAEINPAAIGGFALDIAQDPLTWLEFVGVGMGKLFRKAFRGGARKLSSGPVQKFAKTNEMISGKIHPETVGNAMTDHNFLKYQNKPEKIVEKIRGKSISEKVAYEGDVAWKRGKSGKGLLSKQADELDSFLAKHSANNNVVSKADLKKRILDDIDSKIGGKTSVSKFKDPEFYKAYEAKLDMLLDDTATQKMIRAEKLEQAGIKGEEAVIDDLFQETFDDIADTTKDTFTVSELNQKRRNISKDLLDDSDFYGKGSIDEKMAVDRRVKRDLFKYLGDAVEDTLPPKLAKGYRFKNTKMKNLIDIAEVSQYAQYAGISGKPFTQLVFELGTAAAAGVGIGTMTGSTTAGLMGAGGMAMYSGARNVGKNVYEGSLPFLARQLRAGEKYTPLTTGLIGGTAREASDYEFKENKRNPQSMPMQGEQMINQQGMQIGDIIPNVIKLEPTGRSIQDVIKNKEEIYEKLNFLSPTLAYTFQESINAGDPITAMNMVHVGMQDDTFRETMAPTDYYGKDGQYKSALPTLGGVLFDEHDAERYKQEAKDSLCIMDQAKVISSYNKNGMVKTGMDSVIKRKQPKEKPLHQRFNLPAINIG